MSNRWVECSVGALLAALALAGCATGHVTVPGPALSDPPYLAVHKPLPPGVDRIYLLAAIPGRIVFRNDCVLFERIDRNLVLPVFEAGMTAGRDARGPWLFDPVSKQYFRDGTKVFAGGGGSGETVDGLARRRVLQRALPDHCRAAMTADAVLILNPGLTASNFEQ